MQQLSHEWEGHAVTPPAEFRFSLTAEGLVFCARRQAAAQVHPQGKCGCFQEELWKYDAAEFFISTADGERYLEFNLSPNGAWWAHVFSAPRVSAVGFESYIPAGICATGKCGAEGWAAEALVPHGVLQELGIDPATCRLAACAILESPQQIFLTTALPCNTQPDFHRPDLWESAHIC